MSPRSPSPVQRSIKQRKPFRSEGQEAVVALFRIADELRTRLAMVVEPHGLTLQQYNVLRILRGAGRDGLPTLEIAARMIERSPGVTRLLDRLEAKRLITRSRSEEDRRSVTCRLTPKGLRLVDQLDDPVDQADAAALEMLPAAERTQLVRTLNRVVAGLA